MKMLRRLFQYSALGGLWQFARWLPQGVRFHPAAHIAGDPARVLFGKGAKIGPGCLFEASNGGEIRVGGDSWFYKDVEIRCDGKVDIGAGSTFQRGVTINGDVSIGSGCILAPNVFVSSGTHVFDYLPELPIREQEKIYRTKVGRYSKKVRIGDDCWLGINTVVMPGVSIGRGAIVGANSVVTKNIPDFAVAAGSPAKILKSRLTVGE